jgi:nucleosome binding factor SPN SPT16 subunit
MKPPQDMIWLIGISSKGQNWNKLMKEIHNLRKNNTEREREREKEQTTKQHNLNFMVSSTKKNIK